MQNVFFIQHRSFGKFSLNRQQVLETYKSDYVICGNRKPKLGKTAKFHVNSHK